MRKTLKAILFVLAFLLLGLFNEARARISAFILESISVMAIDGFDWLQAYWRVIQDSINSGYVRGMPFRTPEGHWAISWRLGGQPFTYEAFRLTCAIIFVLSITLLSVYSWNRYMRLRYLKQHVLPENPKVFFSFRKCVSLAAVSLLVFMVFLGFSGTRIDHSITIFGPPGESSLSSKIHT